MSFYEDDRIRRKNWEWNFPTPEVNEKARSLLIFLSLLGYKIKDKIHFLEECVRADKSSGYRADVLKTALAIAQKNR